MRPQPTVYLLLGHARAARQMGRIASGGRHAIVGFVIAADRDGALPVAEQHFREAGWVEIAFTRGAVVDPGRVADSHPDGAAAYRDCLEYGVGGVAFDEPIAP